MLWGAVSLTYAHVHVHVSFDGLLYRYTRHLRAKLLPLLLIVVRRAWQPPLDPFEGIFSTYLAFQTQIICLLYH